MGKQMEIDLKLTRSEIWVVLRALQIFASPKGEAKLCADFPTLMANGQIGGSLLTLVRKLHAVTKEPLTVA